VAGSPVGIPLAFPSPGSNVLAAVTEARADFERQSVRLGVALYVKEGMNSPGPQFPNARR
jgi:hypothetical protein